MANNEELKEVVDTSTQNESPETPETSDATKESPQETAGEPEVEEVDDNDIEFDDSDLVDEEEPSSVEKKPLNKRERNREKAKQRREQREKELHNSYLNGVKTATGNVNPYTNTKMETDEDVQDYLTMKEMEAEGLDPTDSRDYIKFTREKQKKEMAETKAQEEANLKYRTELLEFKTKYNDVDIENLVNNDQSWKSLILPQIQQGKSLLEAYEAVNTLISKSVNERVETLADEKAKKQVQNSLASVGSQTVGEAENKPLDIWSMTDEEFRQYQKERGL
jgi:hypothetical protein